MNDTREEMQGLVRRRDPLDELAARGGIGDLVRGAVRNEHRHPHVSIARPILVRDRGPSASTQPGQAGEHHQRIARQFSLRLGYSRLQ